MRLTPCLSRLLVLACLPLVWSCSAHQTTNLDAQPTTEFSRAVQENGAPPDSLQAQDELEVAAQGQTEEDLTPPESEANASQEVQDLEKLGAWEEAPPRTPKGNEIHSDFPITVNRQVEYYLDLFQNQQRKIFAGWLARSGRYVPYMRQQLAEAGLPQDLVYLSMIESGFKTTAYSTAGAAGLWQFIAPTATRFGLQVNTYVDERRDPVRSTQAAIKYLTDLYGQFDNWYMAVAAYNAGEGKISGGLQKFNCTNFWDLAKEDFLALETKRYVPQLIAAIIIAKSPKDYGFDDIAYEPPLAYETVKVPARTQLAAVAVACNSDLDTLHNLNRQLTKQQVPPGSGLYDLKVPPGAARQVAANLPRVHATVSTQFKEHVVGGKDSVDSVCAKYSLSKITLLKANNLRKAKLTPGTILRIPYQTTQYALLSQDELQQLAKTDKKPSDVAIHTVKRGETLAQIASLYGSSEKELMAWNKLKASQLKTGQKLTVLADSKATEAAPQAAPPQQRQAKDGKDKDTAPVAAAPKTITTAKTKVAANAKPTAVTTAAASNSASKTKVAVTETAKSTVSGKDAKGQPTRYLVKSGDSLWTIAERFDLSPDDIKKWNKLDGNRISPGLSLIIRGKS